VCQSKIAILDASANRLTSPNTPACIASSGIKSLNLARNNLTGTLPAFKNMDAVALAQNHLTGPVAPEKLKGVKYINLAHNQMSGDASGIDKMTSARVVNLAGNQLKGRVDSLKFSKMPKLYGLSVSNNKLEGPLPPAIYKATRLSHLDLSDNKLSGNLPTDLAKTHMKHMYLDNNQFTGKPPKGMRVEQRVDLSSNQFDCHVGSDHVYCNGDHENGHYSYGSHDTVALLLIIGAAVAVFVCIGIVTVLVVRRRRARYVAPLPISVTVNTDTKTASSETAYARMQ